MRLVLVGVDADQFAQINGDVEIVNTRAPRLSALPNEDGTFGFSGVPPGTCVLSAGLEKMVAGKCRHLTTFFPGTHRFAAAGLIQVERAAQHDGFDFVIATE